MHMEQKFLDSNDAYVWLYDPTPWYYYIAGAAIVLGIIAVCLFPLWPMEMRQGVYYLSVAAAGFLVFIIVLAIIKYILFVILFIGSAGKLKFWIFPNLTEDVGFFESFWPVYVYTYDKPKKEKLSDDEESSDDEEDEKGRPDLKQFFFVYLKLSLCKILFNSNENWIFRVSVGGMAGSDFLMHTEFKSKLDLA